MPIKHVANPTAVSDNTYALALAVTTTDMDTINISVPTMNAVLLLDSDVFISFLIVI